MKGLDVIIPVHEYHDNVKALLTRCLHSLKDMAVETKNHINIDVYIVGPESLPSDEILNLITLDNEFNSLNVVINDGDLDFCSQVNLVTTNECKNEYFMIVEYDDAVMPKWLNMVSPYISKREKCPMFLPLVETYDIKNATKPLYYINEIGWSSSFSDKELGCLSTETLLDFCNFNITGAIINRNKFNKAGGLKPSIKLSFGYELMLRLSHLYKTSQSTDGDLFVVPKVGYFHFVNREDSLTSEYYKNMSKEEGSWWIKLATEEYTYKKDRKKVYTPDKE
jgi:hypothetical protein